MNIINSRYIEVLLYFKVLFQHMHGLEEAITELLITTTNSPENNQPEHIYNTKEY
jgi:hypothetical protein